MTWLIYFLVTLLASAAGAICGIGGGVVIKPVLDVFHLASVSTISFLSGCAVLSMCCYSVGKSIASKERQVSMATGTPLAIGAAVGGLLGKQLFSLVKAMFENQNAVGAVQAACLAFCTGATLLYTLCKSRIRTHQLQSIPLCAVVGVALGLISSFLGIGGGPMNLVVFYYFFSMDTKTAAANSLYVVFFSQLASLLMTLFTGTVPPFQWSVLLLMMAGGIGGGILGRQLNKKMDNRAVEKLFIALMVLIVCISVSNAWRYSR